MSNFTPETATVIGALPYTNSVDADLSPGGSGLYVPDCLGAEHHSCWWKYTTGANEFVFAFSAGYAGDAVRPWVSIWKGTPPTLTRHTNVAAETQAYCGQLGVTKWFEVVCQPSTTYYFQVNSPSSSAVGVLLAINAQAPPALASPAGSFLISDDIDGFPGVVIDATTGAIARLVNIGAGEVGDFLPTGELCFPLLSSSFGVRVYDRSYTLIATHSTGVNVVVGIKSDKHNTFYFMAHDLVAGGIIVGTISKTGVVGGTTWTLPLNSDQATCFAVSQDGTRLYYAQRIANGPVHAYDLTNSVALADLVAGQGATITMDGRGDGFTLADGSVFFQYHNNATFPTLNQKLKRFSNAGALLQQYDLDVVFPSGTVHYAYRDETTFGVWGLDSTNHHVLAVYRISDGVVIYGPYTLTVFMQPSGQPPAGSPFGISESCPLLMTAVDLALPFTVSTLARCETWTPQEVTITGSGFSAATVVTATDPDGHVHTSAPGGDIAIVSVTSTTIALLMPLVLCGAWVFHVNGFDVTASTPTDCECCVSTKTNLINEALLKIGVSQTIQVITEQSREAYTGTILFDKVLKEVLRQFPWAFATKYARSVDAFTETEAMYLVAGTPEAPINGDWSYAYRYPDDCVFARRIVGPAGRRFDPAPIPFRVGRLFNTDTPEWDAAEAYLPGALVARAGVLYVSILSGTNHQPPNATYWRVIADADALLVFTNQVDAVLEYTMLVECAANFSDALFEDALSWKLAWKLAPSLSRDPKMVQSARDMYLQTLDTAAAVNAKEHQPEPHGDADWTQARN